MKAQFAKIHALFLAHFFPYSEILADEGEKGRDSEKDRGREGGREEVYRVAELAQQIGINGDKLSWPVIDEAHRP